MRLSDLIREGDRTMTVCNACRYCEQYCPVFQAMERRLTFTPGDLSYLSNLCHNCGECLYACQYAPPHEFAIAVPRTLARIRLATYEEYCWPRPLAAAFQRQGVLTALAVVVLLSGMLFGMTEWANPGALWQRQPRGDFYSVIPHGAMVGMFGAVGLFVALAIAIGVTRFWRDVHRDAGARPNLAAVAKGLRDAFTLKHLHSAGADCTTDEEVRTPWRRIWHHATAYGFLLCFASTSVAAAYHTFLGWHAPYGYLSLPVLLGTIGGIGLLIGPAGLWFVRGSRDADLADPSQKGLDEAFMTLLFLTSATGLLLLVLRDGPAMGVVLIVHLGVVLALFLSLPYGKFIHGFYRTAALVKNATEESTGTPSPDSF